jgi:AraC-like DNA-binding protein
MNASDEPNLSDQLKDLGAVPTMALQLFDQLPEALFWIKDTKGRFRWVNLTLVVLHGRLSRRELIGKTDSDFFDFPQASQFYQDDAKALSGEAVIDRTERVVFNQVGRWYSTTKLPLMNPRNQIVGSVGIAVPVRKRDDAEVGAGTPLAKAMQFIGQNCRDSLTNRRIAQAAGLSLRLFYRQFRESCGCAPHDYLIQLRIRQSCEPLALSDRSVAHIAKEFNFSHPAHYTRTFRRVMGLTPVQYREGCRRRRGKKVGRNSLLISA